MRPSFSTATPSAGPSSSSARRQWRDMQRTQSSTEACQPTQDNSPCIRLDAYPRLARVFPLLSSYSHLRSLTIRSHHQVAKVRLSALQGDGCASGSYSTTVDPTLMSTLSLVASLCIASWKCALCTTKYGAENFSTKSGRSFVYPIASPVASAVGDALGLETYPPDIRQYPTAAEVWQSWEHLDTGTDL